MTLPFLNKSKKYIACFLAAIFVCNLLFLFINVKTVKGWHATEVTQVFNMGLLQGILQATAVTAASTAAVIAPINATAVTTAVATKDQVAGNWWERTVKWFQDKWYQISDTITQKSFLLKEYVLDPLFWTMANVVIDQFGDAIVDWIRNGFEGSPMFLSDPEGFFRDTANQASGAIIDKFNVEWLCDPLGKLRLDLNFFFPGTDRAKYACTFNDIAGTFKNIAGIKYFSDWVDFNVNVHQQNIVRLYGSDYRHGGFLMWLTTAQKKNNDIGRTIQTANDAYTAASWSVGTQRFQLASGSGFFGLRKCVERGAAPLKEGETGPPKQVCLKYIDTTPGKLVQEQLNQAGTGDLKKLHIADEVDEIIGALATTLIGWMLTGGNDNGGVLGYDKNAGYSASNRDHFEALSNSQTLTKKKTDISGQIIVIKNGNDQYNNALKNHFGVSAGASNDAGIVLAKLKCIRTTSANDVDNIYDDSDCLGVSEEIKNVKLENATSSVTEITTDINNIENDIKESGAVKYDDYEIAISARTAELLDEFENKIMMAISLEEADGIISEYCYSYDENAKTGTVCGLYTDKYGNTKKETHKTHSEEEANAIDGETMNKVPELKTNELEYLCVLNKYTKTEKVEEGSCKAFVGSSSS